MPIYEIYRLLQGWFTEWGGMDSSLALELIRERNLPLEETLMYLPTIHGGYSKITNTSTENETKEE